MAAIESGGLSGNLFCGVRESSAGEGAEENRKKKKATCAKRGTWGTSGLLYERGGAALFRLSLLVFEKIRSDGQERSTERENLEALGLARKRRAGSIDRKKRLARQG